MDSLFISSEKAASILKSGGIVGIPTETVYGLAANALDENAVQKIFVAKGRPADNPLIVHVAPMVGGAYMRPLPGIAREISPVAQKLMDVFWPGPLTLVLKKTDAVPDIVTAGLDTVAVRMPSHPMAQEIIRLAGVPLAVPSANKSGRPSPTTAEHVREDFGDTVPVVDGGSCAVGVESTVVDVTCDPPVILRQGGITAEEIEKVLGVPVGGAYMRPLPADTPRSPGMKYRHYAPKAKVALLPLGVEDGEVLNIVKKYLAEGESVGIMITKELAVRLSPEINSYDVKVNIVGSETNLSTVATGIFAGLRALDSSGVKIILAESFSENGIGAAVMERLNKSANG